MQEKLNRRMPAAAMVIAIIAFGVAIGGGAYAAKVKLKANSVKTKQIKNGAVTTPKVAPKAITAATLGDTVEVTADSAATPDGDGSTNGGAVIGKTGVVTATCPAGSKLLTGGANWSTGADSNIYLKSSHPEGNSWKAEGIVDFGAQGTAILKVRAVCLK